MVLERISFLQEQSAVKKTPFSGDSIRFPVTKSYLPNKEKYLSYVNEIYKSGILTNNGPLVKRLEEKLKERFNLEHIILVANGSLALQVVYKALGLRGNVVTTPYSFVATTSTLVWEGLKPIFSDIERSSFNIDPIKTQNKINPETSAILGVHVYGNPCSVEALDDLAKSSGVKLIYDAAHAFDVTYKGQSLLKYGDASVLSFHATKLFHCIEGGAVATNNGDLAKKIRLLINFGIKGVNQIEGPGTNFKMNEFEAAMGLCLLDDIESIKEKRKKIADFYRSKLSPYIEFQKWSLQSEPQGAYAPVLLESEALLLEVEKALQGKGVWPRRYFYPSLDSLDYLQDEKKSFVSQDIASRILCLPIYYELDFHDQEQYIINTINSVIHNKGCR